MLCFPVQETKESDHISYIISDYQRSQMELENMKVDTSMQVNFVPLNATVQQNLYIDTCFVNTPFIQLDAPNELVVRVKNNGDNEIENIPLKLTLTEFKNLSQVFPSMEIHGRGTIVVTISQPGWQSENYRSQIIR